MKDKLQNIKAEQACLGCILLDNRTMDENLLSPDDFVVGVHKEIFRLMLENDSAGISNDIVTLHDSFKDASYLSSLLDMVPTAYNFPQYQKQVLEKSKLRKLHQMSLMVDQAINEGLEAEQVSDQTEEALTNMKVKNEQGFETFKSEMFDHVEMIINTGKNGHRGIETGFQGIDSRLYGLYEGQVIVIGARPGQGKTTLALNILSNIAKRGIPVGLLSLEMDKHELMTRVICSEAMINSAAAKAGRLNEADVFRYRETAKRVYSWPLFFNDNPTTTLERFKSEARRLVRREGVKVLAVDYLQLMHTSKRMPNRYEEVTYISREMKILSGELKTPIIVISQLNRGSEGNTTRRPKLSDLRDSGAIEQDANVVILLHREDNDSIESEVLIEKNRSGPTGLCNLEFIKQFNLFKDKKGDLG